MRSWQVGPVTRCQKLRRPPQRRCCRGTCAASGAMHIPPIDLQHNTSDHVEHLDMAPAAEEVVSHLPSPTTKVHLRPALTTWCCARRP